MCLCCFLCIIILPRFLESPAASHTTDDGDDQDDVEYNFLADHQEEEKEEFRFDKAVRIPRM